MLLELVESTIFGYIRYILVTVFDRKKKQRLAAS